MTLLDSIDGPDDVKALDPSQLDQLAQEIRDFLVTSVSRTGGHLGPNLGVVGQSWVCWRRSSPRATSAR